MAHVWVKKIAWNTKCHKDADNLDGAQLLEV